MKKFITFEGGEGSGKTTQCKLLSNSLLKINEENMLTREPGGTVFSEKIRKILVNNSQLDLTVDSEILLIYAARHDHLKKVIIPSLRKKTVICDRFIHSTFAYQSSSKNFLTKLKFIHKNFAFNLMPDITIYLDIKPELGIERSLNHKKVETKFENKNILFHKQIRRNFINLEKKSKKIFKINGEKSEKKIHTQIVDIINSKHYFKKLLPYAL
ncbi:MAG: dTMP kinase [Rickettsiales bacterium]|nr:dTMP kinase [Rickettsiales bacterium]